MDKKKKKLSPLARFRGFIQAGATLLTNLHLPNFCKRSAVSGRRKIRLRAGAELLFLPGRGRCLSGGSIPGGGGLFQVPLFLLHYRHPHPLWGVAGAVHLRFPLPIRVVSGAFAQDPIPQAFHQKAEAAALFKVCGAAGHGGAAALLAVNELGMGDPFFLQVSLPRRACWRVPFPSP